MSLKNLAAQFSFELPLTNNYLMHLTANDFARLLVKGGNYPLAASGKSSAYIGGKLTLCMFLNEPLLKWKIFCHTAHSTASKAKTS